MELQETDVPDLFCCDWLYDVREKESFVACGGADGMLTVCSTLTGDYKHLYSHGYHVYDIQVHPTQSLIFATASADLSARLWNAKTGHLIAIFIPATEYQRAGLTTLSWRSDGSRLLVGEEDGTVRVWNTETLAIKKATEYSYIGQPSSIPLRSNPPGPSYGKTPDIAAPPVAQERIPVLSTPWVIHNYVDWVRWWGDFAFAKGPEGNIMMFQFQVDRLPYLSPEAKARIGQEVLHMYQLDYNITQESDLLWFVRAAISPSGRYLAVGHKGGQVIIWDIPNLIALGTKKRSTTSKGPRQKAWRVLTTLGKAQIRALSFSNDEKTLIAIADTATIYRCTLELE
ncbi:WD40-repeat-containing domain protein [Powellomyces hirtus]|nr:WD40-repeat-containing domain protein [Powellomyces hirtus]